MNDTTKSMHRVLHSFGDWALETQGMNRLERSIYFDMRTLYLTGVGLSSDVARLAWELGCQDDGERAALMRLLSMRFKLDKKTQRYTHLGWNKILRAYREHKNDVTNSNDSNGDVTTRNDKSNDDVTNSNAMSNAMSNAQRQAKLREQAKQFKAFLQSLNIDFDSKIRFSELKKLFLQHGGVLVDDVTERNARNEKVTAHNEKKTFITITNNSSTTATTTRVSNFAEMVETVADPFVLPERFAMFAAWQPDNLDFVNAMLRRACLPACETDLGQAAMLDFVAYWSAKPDEMRTAQEWDSALIQSMQRYRAIHGNRYELSGCLKTVEPQAQRGLAPTVQPISATAKGAACLKAAKAALLDGRAQPLTAAPVLAAVVDGLLDLLGCGLKYPPAADAWDVTLQAWDKAFAALRLNADDVARVQTAFANVKRSAQSANGSGEFPKVHEVIAALPMVWRERLEKMETPDEKAARKAAGAQKAGALLASMGKFPKCGVVHDRA